MGIAYIVLAFWVIVIVVVVIAAVISNPWLLLILIPAVIAIIASKDEKEVKRSEMPFAPAENNVGTNRNDEVELIKSFDCKHDEIKKLSAEYYTLIYNYAKDRLMNIETAVGPYDIWYLRRNDFYLFCNDKVAKEFVKRDELDHFEYFVYGSNEPHYSYERSDSFEEKKTQMLIEILNKHLIKNNEWEQNETRYSVIYFLIRNGIVKYYHDIFLGKYEAVQGETPLKALCEVEAEKGARACDYTKLAYLYTFYRVYENDLFSPLKKEYDAISKIVDKYVEEMARGAYEKRLLQPIVRALPPASEQSFSQVPEDFDELCNDIEKSHTDTNTVSGDYSNETIYVQDAIDFETQPIVTKQPLEIIDELSGEEFEQLIAKVLKEMGYATELTAKSNDYGIDIIAHNPFLKLGVQAKRYTDNVGNAAIQEVVAGLKHYNLDKAMVATNSYFTANARKLADDNGVILWDRDILAELIKSISYKEV